MLSRKINIIFLHFFHNGTKVKKNLFSGQSFWGECSRSHSPTGASPSLAFRCTCKTGILLKDECGVYVE